MSAVFFCLQQIQRALRPTLQQAALGADELASPLGEPRAGKSSEIAKNPGRKDTTAWRAKLKKSLAAVDMNPRPQATARIGGFALSRNCSPVMMPCR
jgi:hypothetical protein